VLKPFFLGAEMSTKNQKQARGELKSHPKKSIAVKKQQRPTLKGKVQPDARPGVSFHVKAKDQASLLAKMTQIAQQESNKAHARAVAAARANIPSLVKAQLPASRAGSRVSGFISGLKRNPPHALGSIRLAQRPHLIDSKRGFSSLVSKIPIKSAGVGSMNEHEVNHNSVVYEQNPIPSSALNGVKFRDSLADIHRAAEDYAFCLLETAKAAVLGMCTGVPDNTMRPTYKFSTYSNVQVNTAVNGSTNDLFVRVAPAMSNQIQVATAFAAGLPTTFSYTNNPAYSSMSTWVQFLRVSAMEVQLRNLTQVQNQGGVCLQGNCDWATSGTTTWTNLAQARRFMTRTLGKPGDVGRVAWTPVSGVGVDNTIFDCSDSQWKIYSAGNQTGDTMVMFWCQCPAAQYMLVTVTTMIEVLVLPNLESVYNPTTILIDSVEANACIMAELSKFPLTDLARNVFTDDGLNEFMEHEAKSMIGGLAGEAIGGLLFNKLMKKPVVRAAPTSGVFGSHCTSADCLERVLAVLTDKDYAYLFKKVLSFNSHIDPKLFQLPQLTDLRLDFQDEVKEEMRVARLPKQPEAPVERATEMFSIDELLEVVPNAWDQDERKVYFETETIMVREQLPDGTLGPPQMMEKKVQVDLEDQFIKAQPGLTTEEAKLKTLSVTDTRDVSAMLFQSKQGVRNSSNSSSSWQQVSEPTSPSNSTSSKSFRSKSESKR
jgi:hypothetical protein